MIELFIFILGTGIGVMFTYILVSKKEQEKHKEENTKAEQELLAEKERRKETEQELLAEKERRMKAEAEIKAFLSKNSSQDTAIKNMMEAVAAKAMQTNSETFLKMAKQVMGNYIGAAGNTIKENKHNLSAVIEPLRQKLDKQEALVRELENHNNRTFGSLKNYLEQLNKGYNLLAKETSTLSTALKAPKVRGRWGEIGLKRLVEFSGMSNYCDFDEQLTTNTEHGKLRPDMIVNLPDRKKIVVDSKVPLNAFLEAIETDDEALKAELAKKHRRAVEQHLKNLASKAYWAQFEDTVDFVVMYIEVEPAFGLALSENKNLVTDAMSNRIVFATPTTLITLLQTVSYSWKQHKATENATKIWQQSKEIYERMANFADYFRKIGSGLNNLNKTYNQAVGSWESRIMPSLRKMEQLGVSSEKKEIKPTEEQDIVPRELRKL